MKTSHVWILAVSILLGCAAIAIVDGVKDRYHYSNLAVEGNLARVDRFTGAVEVYDKNRGWIHVLNR